MLVTLDKGKIMNLDLIKKEVIKNVNNSVEIKVYGMRNRVETVVGIISNVYPNIFTVSSKGENKSFRYADIITGEIKVKYL